MDDNQAQEANVFETTYDTLVERLPYLKIGGSHSETVKWTNDLPIFSVTSQGRGLSNSMTEARVDAHIEQTAAFGSLLYRAALRAISQVNANLDRHDIPRAPYAVELKQHMTVNRRGQLQTESQIKVTRVER